MKIPTAQLEPAFLGILPDKAAEEQNSTSKETARIWITVMQVKELWTSQDFASIPGSFTIPSKSWELHA